MNLPRINSLMLSICGHIFVGLLLYYGVPINTLSTPQDHLVIVDVINVSDLTNLAVKHKAKKKISDESAEKKAVKEVKAVEEPKSSEPEIKPVEKASEVKLDEPEAIPIPDPDKPKEAKPVEQKKETQKKPEVKKVKPEDKKKSEKKPKKKKVDPFADAAFLKTLEEATKKSEQQEKEERELKDVLEGLETDSPMNYNADIPMSVSEVDAIRSQIQKVWNTSSFNGAETAGLRVTLQITLDREGNVQSVNPMLERSQSPYYQAFVDSTVRAVKMASPLQHLPVEKYNSWSVTELVFDSSGMIQ